MRTPMPSPKGTNYAGLYLPSRGPHAAYDAAPNKGDEPDYRGNLIAALGRWGVRELNDTQRNELNILIETHGAGTATAKDSDDEIAENVIGLLKAAGLGDEDLGQVRQLLGGKAQPEVGGNLRAMDAAGYYSRFPSARHIGHLG